MGRWGVGAVWVVLVWGGLGCVGGVVEVVLVWGGLGGWWCGGLGGFGVSGLGCVGVSVFHSFAIVVGNFFYNSDMRN
jgi:hypothetical protein